MKELKCLECGAVLAYVSQTILFFPVQYFNERMKRPALNFVEMTAPSLNLQCGCGHIRKWVRPNVEYQIDQSIPPPVDEIKVNLLIPLT